MFGKGWSVKGYVAKAIEDLQAFVSEELEIAKKVTAEGNVPKQDYKSIRTAFNVLVLSAIMGCQFKKDKNGKLVTNKDGKLVTKGFYALPNAMELATIMNIVTKFEEDIMPIYIPEASSGTMGLIRPLVIPEKFSRKEFDSVLTTAVTIQLTQEQFNQIVVMAWNNRQRQKRVAGYVAAGVVVTVVAGGAVYYMLKKKDESSAEEQVETIDDFEDVEIEEEVPEVEISDDEVDVVIE